MTLTLLHSEWPKLFGVLAVLSVLGLKGQYKIIFRFILNFTEMIQVTDAFIIMQAQL